VVTDYGLWGRDERSALRQAAAPERSFPAVDPKSSERLKFGPAWYNDDA